MTAIEIVNDLYTCQYPEVKPDMYMEEIKSFCFWIYPTYMSTDCYINLISTHAACADQERKKNLKKYRFPLEYWIDPDGEKEKISIGRPGPFLTKQFFGPVHVLF